jgi:hypothetical protein
MAATAFTKFDPFSFLRNRELADTPAKPANVAKVLPQADGERADTLASLAALAERSPHSQNLETVPAERTDNPKKRADIIEHDGRTARAGNRGSQEQTKANTQRPYERTLAALCERCPDLVEEHRWHEAITDANAFVIQWGVQAAALGWTARDLFGLANIPDRPSPNYQRLSRYDQTGLVWLLQGRRVVELTKDKAVIQTATGTLSFRRRTKLALASSPAWGRPNAPAAVQSEAMAVESHGLPIPDDLSIPGFLLRRSNV